MYEEAFIGSAAVLLRLLLRGAPHQQFRRLEFFLYQTAHHGGEHTGSHPAEHAVAGGGSLRLGGGPGLERRILAGAYPHRARPGCTAACRRGTGPTFDRAESVPKPADAA